MVTDGDGNVGGMTDSGDRLGVLRENGGGERLVTEWEW